MDITSNYQIMSCIRCGVWGTEAHVITLDGAKSAVYKTDQDKKITYRTGGVKVSITITDVTWIFNYEFFIFTIILSATVWCNRLFFPCKTIKHIKFYPPVILPSII